MVQHTAILHHRAYDRTDYIALKAYFLGMTVQDIFDNYFCASVRTHKQIPSSRALRTYLDEMRHRLADGLALQHPLLAQSLRKMQQTGEWSKLALDYIAQASWQRQSTPTFDDDLGQWMKPVVTRCLSREHLTTVGDLCAHITARGPTWWRSIPRIGQGKAQVIAQWLQRAVGFSVPSAVMAREAYVPLPQSTWEVWDRVADTRSQQLDVCLRYPLSRLDWSHTGQGRNRHAGRCQIQARTDWDVFDIYLQRFVDRPHTFKSYRKEMERFVLWVRTVAQTSLCGVDVSHGQQYCEFLRAPDPTWLAPFAAPRGSLLWRPFVAPLSAKGIAYAQQVLGAWFQWLVDVQYLAGNPWKAVQKPLLVQAIHPIQIERALDAQTWHSLSAKGGVLDRLCDADAATAAAWLKIPPAPTYLQAQCRLLRAAILLMGCTGLRVSEAASAQRHQLTALKHSSLYRLDVIGKRHKARFVIVPPRVLEALMLHWQDSYSGSAPIKGHDPLLSAVHVPALHAHSSPSPRLTAAQVGFFSGKDLSQMMIKGLGRIAESEAFAWSDEQRAALRRLGTHGLRHTFATLGVQHEHHPIPVDLMKDLLGHASLQTTSLYVQTSIKRAERVMADFFEKE